MNILHISTAHSWRGGERQVLYLMDGLKSVGVSNHLMSPKNSALAERCSLKTEQQLTYKKGIPSLIQNVLSLINYCKNHKIDIVHGHDSHAHTLIWMAYKFGRLGCKSIITRRLMNPIKKRSIAKYNYAKISKIICISEAVKTTLLPAIHDTTRLQTIHSAIDTSKVSAGKFPKSQNEFVVGYIAAFTQEKDHHTFIRTAKHLIKSFPQINFKFLLVGQGPLFNQIKTESKSIQDQIEFLGFIKNIKEAYHKIDLILHTSQSEALGTSILDALKFSIPVVATDVGGIPEIIDHEKNGFLCTPGDHKQMANFVIQLATNPNLYDKITKAGIQTLNNFDVNTMVTKTFQLYKRLL
ncbi:MAG: glycosyltransferase family 4 protein [Saprospiraceae bacterium]|nr:glycosyltransferase family 4 protein [Saprospiraceae bacterium]